jgi:hypothetical protein
MAYLKTKRSFKSGDAVRHSRLGVGTVVDEWGAWVEVNDLGKALEMNGAGIYDVEFTNHGRRSVKADWLTRRDVSN